MAQNDILMETRGLTKRFAGLTALDGINFQIHRGELRCLIGPNGAGKTTFFNVVTGKFPPSGGRVIFKEQDITGLGPYRICRMGIGRKFQIPAVFTDLTVGENLLVSRHGKDGTLFLLSGTSRPGLDASMADLLHKVGLYERRGDRAGALSHGERQRLEIAMALVNGPELLLLDEPTAGMTVAETRATADLIRAISTGITTIIIEHDISFIREIAEMVTVLHRGRILTEGPIAEIERNEAVRNVYLGRQA